MIKQTTIPAFLQKVFKPAICLIFTFLSSSVAASPLQFQNALVPEMPPGAQTMAAYMSVVNDSDTDCSIIQISSPEFESVEMHRSVVKDGVASMQPMKSLVIPAHSTLELAPGGIHLMLIKPVKHHSEGQTVILKLQEEDGTEHTLAITVEKSQSKHMHHHHD